MNIQVNDFRWEPGKNDAEYIKLLESSRDEWQKIAQKAIAKLKAQESISEQDRKDLDILHRVMEGELEKSLCYDYVIYNGEWYRNHKWDWPNNEPLEPRIVDGEPECGKCLYELRRDADNYCPCCGRKRMPDDFFCAAGEGG